MFRNIASLILLIISQTAIAEQLVPIAVQEIINKLSPEAEIKSVCDGDLNNDGLNDYAVIISYQAPTHDETYHQIVVVKASSDGVYGLISKSLDIGTYPHGSPDMEIKRQSLFVHFFSSDQSSGMMTTSQFRYQENDLFLIGEVTHSWAPLFSNEPGIKHDSKVSINLITGEKVVTDVIGHKKSVKKSIQPAQKLERLSEFGSNM